MNYQKKNIFTIFLVFTFFINLLLAFSINNCDDLSNPRKDIKKDEDLTSKTLPKIGDSSITINTPENTTYTGPMSGYYYGTHGFECDEDGALPKWFDVGLPDSSGFVRVESSLAGHNKVCQLRKNGGTQFARLDAFFPENATAGTLEFWIYKDTDSSTDLTGFSIGSATVPGSIVFGIVNGDLYQHYWGSHTYFAYDVFTKNTWHHIRWDFNLTKGWQIQLDDTWYGSDYAFSIEAGATVVDRFRLGTGFSGVNPNYGTWMDAFGYSWHPDYSIGDNLEEGMLLSFHNTTNLDWMGYSLDNQANKTVLGNTTIKMPSEGNHTIQMFGNDSTGTKYHSEKRCFTVDSGDFIYISPSAKIIIDKITELGLYVEIELNAAGYLKLQRTETNLVARNLGSEFEAFYFYNITIFDVTHTKNNAIITSIKIRFYYDSDDVKKPENLYVLHYIWDIAQVIYLWAAIDADALNTGAKYIEISTTELSVFCLAEIKIPGGDKKESTEPSIWLFFTKNAIFIIILSAIGVSAPALYVVKSRSKKKKAQDTTKGFKAKAQEKMRVLEKTQFKTEVSAESKDIVKKSTSIIPKPSLGEAPKKLKKSASTEKTLSKEEQLKQLEEVKKTENEVNLEANIDLCMIHKGKIQGVIYVCPKCSSKYCLNCAKALMSRGEHCWVCDSPFYVETDAKEPKSKILKDIVDDNKIIIDKLKESNGNDSFNALNNLSLTALSEEDWEKIEKIGMEDKEKSEFLKELLSFKPEERSQIIDDMLKRLNEE